MPVRADRPYVLLSCAISLDGFIDDAGAGRLVLSGPQDLDRVDEVRAGCDAVCVGAGTIRVDDPRLGLRSSARRAARAARGQPPEPLRVTITGAGSLDPAARFFAAGGQRPRVYAGSAGLAAVRDRLGRVADVRDAGDPVDLRAVLTDLAGTGVGRLMVEGGTATHTAFLAAGLADELHLAVAPFFVGDSLAPRFVAGGPFPWNRDNRAALAEVIRAGDMAVLRYALSDRFQG